MMQFQYTARAYRPTETASQRIAGLVFIAAVHAGIIYALLSALKFVPIPPAPRPFDWHIIPDDKILPPPPVPQDPRIPRPQITDIVPPTVDIQLEPGPGAITNPITPPQVQPAQEMPHVATLDPPRPPPIIFTPVRALAATHTIPDYPPVSRRLGEQGTLRLKLTITADGSVSDAQIESSSGHTRLDEAAVQWVKEHWRYEPAHEGTKAVASTTVAVVTFKLQ